MLPLLLFLSFEIGMFRSDTRLRGSSRLVLVLYLFSFSSESSLRPMPIVAPPSLSPLSAGACGSTLAFSLPLLDSKCLLINAMLLRGLVGVALCFTDSGMGSFLGDPPKVLLLLIVFTLILELELELDEKLSVDRVGFRGLNTGFVMEPLRLPLFPPVACVDIFLGSTGNGLLLE